MALPWFRLYSDFIDNPKVQMLPEHMRYRYVALLCCRCKHETLTDQVVAFHLRLSLPDTLETKALFVEQGIIDTSWHIFKWDKRQFVSDSSTARVHKFRDNVTAMKRFTKRSNGVTRNGPDTEADTETEALASAEAMIR
jgi:hypothetical protein